MMKYDKFTIKVQDALSLKILEGVFIENDIIQIDVNKKNELIFEKVGKITN